MEAEMTLSEIEELMQTSSGAKTGRTFGTQNCKECAKEFFPITGQKYCSKECANPPIECPTCKEMFQPRQRDTQVYCSQNCHYNAEGRKQPEITEYGYVRVYVPKDTPGCRPDGRMLEHRYVMQNHLNRPLKEYEQVHHKDGDKENNDISNLEIRVGVHGKGQTMAHCPTCQCFEHTT